VDDRALDLVQGHDAAESERVLLRVGDDLVGGRSVRRKFDVQFVIGDVRLGVVVTPAAVACDVPREDRQELRRVFGEIDEKPRLRQRQERHERFLDAVQRITRAHALPLHDPSEACTVHMNQLSHPAEETLVAFSRHDPSPPDSCTSLSGGDRPDKTSHPEAMETRRAPARRAGTPRRPSTASRRE
jgi:hypothetical protein